jgi:UDP-2-acetamido-2-deoxy-ribo-hexuluronate aminotransferase
MEFIDLKAQYQASRELINRRIQSVLDHGQYIMGPEVAELEAALAAYTGTASRSRPAPRRCWWP